MDLGTTVRTSTIDMLRYVSSNLKNFKCFSEDLDATLLYEFFGTASIEDKVSCADCSKQVLCKNEKKRLEGVFFEKLKNPQL